MSEDGTERIEPLYERMAGAYTYEGNGDWAKIKDVVKIDDCIEFQTLAVGYESVPHGLREQAYEAYNGDKMVVVGCDVEAEAER